MSIPVLDAKGGVYTLVWEEEQLVAKLTRLREHSDYSVSAEIKLVSTSPVGGHLHQAKLTLTSTAAQKTLAKHLSERLNTIDWPAIIEQASVKVLTEYRKGEPPIEVGKMLVREHLAYRVAPLVVEARPTLIYGPGGSLKSFFATYLSVLVDLAKSENGLDVEKGKVLYLDYETSQDEFRDRVQMIHHGLNVSTPSTILYRYCTRPLAAEVEELQEMVAEHAVNMVVVDSVGSACGGETEGKAEFILTMFSALRSLRCTSLLIDHTNKEGILYGTIYKYNQSRCVWELKRQHELDTDHVHIGLVHRKINTGTLLRTIGFEASFGGDEEVAFSRYDATALDDIAATLSIKDQLRRALRDGKKKREALAELTGLKDATIKTILYRHRDRAGGFILMGEDWGLFDASR